MENSVRLLPVAAQWDIHIDAIFPRRDMFYLHKYGPSINVYVFILLLHRHVCVCVCVPNVQYMHVTRI